MHIRRTQSFKTNETSRIDSTKLVTRNGTLRSSELNAQVKVKSLEQLIQLMSQVNAAVRNGDFGAHLATSIYQLCQHLKTNGQHLEHTHKNELNKVFVSLRQACCRDNGQLGTPCRLKVMELIELRAMGWRPNMAHSQYYLNRAASADAEPPANDPAPPPPSHPAAPLAGRPPPQPHTSPGQPFAPSLPPAAFGHQFVPQPALFDAASPTQPIPPNGYILIPTGGGWTPGIVPMVPQFQSQQPPMLRPHPSDWIRQSAVAAAVQAHFGAKPLPNPAHGKGCKQPQLREEITIRNADSGKIMGVKGRRVAVVEELSKTVISFQKVDHNSRLRVLAICGASAESIQHAKRLIEETIRRNVSPNRAKFQFQCDDGTAPESEPSEPEQGPDISIETSQDGSLKVSCADPDMLEAAQDALREYINLRTRRVSSKEREEAKERRKSMPVQSNTSSTDGPKSTGLEVKDADDKPRSNGTLKAHGSTPNLLADSIKPIVAAPVAPAASPRRYDRENMMALRACVDCDDLHHPMAQLAQRLRADALQRNDTDESAA